MAKRLLVLGLLVAGVTDHALAQNGGQRAVVGIRSGLIAGSMSLSKLDPAFADLDYDGPKGPHMSGFFFLYQVRPHLRLGVETLVANSDETAGTTMSYQAAGPVAELTVGTTWFASLGVHAGGVVVNAMTRDDVGATTDANTGATRGTFLKANGGFVAPYIDVGYRYRRAELGLYAKHASLRGGSNRGGIAPFSATFLGLRLGLRL
ncbi:MAG: hypothetical protein IBJ19_06380 [Gemmatimonadaceae bacterium]|jgi:hypothetical protein|nr:hypothetical protein [Gemmatimonadaceae bacterium]